MDQNQAKIGGKVAPYPALPEFPGQRDWQASGLTSTDMSRTDQQAIKAVNDENVGAQLASRGPQIAMPPASAPQFQATTGIQSNGDMHTGDPRGGKQAGPAKIAGDIISGGAPSPEGTVVLRDLTDGDE